MIPQQNISFSNVAANLALLNDHAIMNYQSGNYMAALTILKEIITSLKELVNNANPYLHQDQHPPQRYTWQAVESIALSEESMYNLGCLFPFYARPFQLVPLDDDDEDMMEAADAESVLRLHLVVVVYNTALVYHAMGVDHDAVVESSNHSLNRDRCFQKAFDLYSMVRRQEASWDCNDPDRFLLLCALYNNMAFIDSYFKNFHQVNCWLESFVRLIQQCDDAWIHYGYRLLDVEDYNYFFDTAFIFQGSLFTLAPAA